MAEKQDDYIALREYDYEDDVMVEIPGKVLVDVLQLMDNFQAAEKTVGFQYVVPSKVTEKEGKVSVEYTNHESMESFMNQQPMEFLNPKGMAALSMFNTLATYHLENIKKGTAVKIGSIKPPQEEENQTEDEGLLS